MNDKQYRLQGVYWASITMFISCTIWILIEIFPPLLADEVPILLCFALIVMVTLSISVFALPFSIVAGYVVAFLLQKAQWYQHNGAKVVVSGVTIASITFLAMYVVGAILVSCLGSECGETISTNIERALRDTVFLKAFIIAAVCGGVTASQLSRLAQQKTA